METLEEEDGQSGTPTPAGGRDGATQTTIRLGKLRVAVEVVKIVNARNQMPRLMRASATSNRAFHIRNGKNPDAATALLVSPETLEKLILKATRSRKLGAVLASLPFQYTTPTGRVRVQVPDNTMRVLKIPRHPESSEG